MRIKFTHTFEDVISLENLLEAWREFVRGKRNKRDVQEFSMRLMNNIILLYNDFKGQIYKHGSYLAFNICDPKPRNIHKATVRDRLLHRAIYRKLYPFFNKTFISHSYSCQIGKGTHKAMSQFRKFAYKSSRNNTKTCWALKCDVKKFFANINHEILIAILKECIPDHDIIWLLQKVINSFSSTKQGIGLPLGNLTSQLFVNIYMNEFDHFVKHRLKAKYYIRYADDFVILSDNKIWLKDLVEPIQKFLKEKLKIELHPDKVYIKTLASGLDFLGWVYFSDHRTLRTATKRRMMGRVKKNPTPETLNSYLELLKHGNTYFLRLEILKKFLLPQEFYT